jgi:hypothetical protein
MRVASGLTLVYGFKSISSSTGKSSFMGKTLIPPDLGAVISSCLFWSQVSSVAYFNPVQNNISVNIFFLMKQITAEQITFHTQAFQTLQDRRPKFSVWQSRFVEETSTSFQSGGDKGKVYFKTMHENFLPWLFNSSSF